MIKAKGNSKSRMVLPNDMTNLLREVSTVEFVDPKTGVAYQISRLTTPEARMEDKSKTRCLLKFINKVKSIKLQEFKLTDER